VCTKFNPFDYEKLGYVVNLVENQKIAEIGPMESKFYFLAIASINYYLSCIPNCDANSHSIIIGTDIAQYFNNVRFKNLLEN